MDMTHFIRAPLNLLWLTGPGSHLELKHANALACLQMLFSAEKSDIQANEYISQQRAMVIHIQQSEQQVDREANPHDTNTPSGHHHSLKRSIEMLLLFRTTMVH